MQNHQCCMFIQWIIVVAYFYLFAMQGETIYQDGLYNHQRVTAPLNRRGGCCCPFFRISEVVFVYYRLLGTLFFFAYTTEVFNILIFSRHTIVDSRSLLPHLYISYQAIFQATNWHEHALSRSGRTPSSPASLLIHP